MNKKILTAAVVIGMTLTSCYYTFQNSRLEGVETVFISSVENKTVKYEIGDLLFKELNDQWMEISNLRISGMEDADGIIEVTVLEFKKETGSIDNEGNPTSVRMIFTVDYSLKKDEKLIGGSESHVFETIFEYTQESTEAELLKKAVEELGDHITEELVEGF